MTVTSTRSDSPSPQTTGKHERDSPPPQTKREHDDSDDEKLFDVHISKAQKISANAGRPKAADYESSAKELILAAANTYRPSGKREIA